MSSAMHAFEKEAAIPKNLVKALGGLGAGAGVGTGAGLVGGAGIGAYKGYREARQEGQGVGHSLGRGAQRMLGAGLKGALIGAGLGAAGGAAAGATGLGNRAINAASGAENAIGSFARSGQRQVHALTGWTPKGFFSPEGVRQLRTGAYAATKSLGKAESAVGKARGGWSRLKATGRVERAKGLAEAAQKSESMGLSSAPGYLKSVKERGVVPTVQAGLTEQWRSGPLSKAFVVAPVAGAAKALTEESPQDGPGKFERAGRSIGGLGYVMSPMPLLGSSILATGFAGGAVGAGRLVDKLKKKRPPQPPPISPSLDPNGPSMPVDYHFTPAAAGQLPEGLMGG